MKNKKCRDIMGDLMIQVNFITVKLLSTNLYWYNFQERQIITQSAGAVEYTDYTSAKGFDSSNECFYYDTKQYDGKDPVLLDLWGMLSTPSLSSLPGSLWPRV